MGRSVGGEATTSSDLGECGLVFYSGTPGIGRLEGGRIAVGGAFVGSNLFVELSGHVRHAVFACAKVQPAWGVVAVITVRGGVCRGGEEE